MSEHRGLLQPKVYASDATLRDFLLVILRPGPRTWRELAGMGFDRDTLLHAVGLIAEAGEHRVRVGPILLELETEPERKP